MKYIAVLLILVAGLLPTACSVRGSGPTDEFTGIRTPQPTFTPAPVVQQIPAQGDQNQSPAQNADAQPVPPPPAEGGAVGGDNAPRVVVNSPLVNVRTGPSTNYDIVATVERGQEFEIVGRNPDGNWWFVCCTDNDYVWINNDLVDTDGPVDSVPITGGATEAPAQDTSGVVTPQAPAPAPVAQFDMIRQEQFAEATIVRVFLYVTDGTTGLEGYSARIAKDGRVLDVDAASFGGQPAFTWPFQDARQRHQNFKMEFPGEAAAGEWTVQLVNADGVDVGPLARFNLSADDAQRELYVRYERR